MDGCPRRDLLDAILQGDRTGIPWRCLPQDCPPRETVCSSFAHWQRDRVFEHPSGLWVTLVSSP
ncbi:transposase [Kitasatospora sp. NPDC091207]|uniref:transposase n=1 Tax=Kitasatospora sp. NPDC091207 TaxID=3364083 RepID=UPI00381B9459